MVADIEELENFLDAPEIHAMWKCPVESFEVGACDENPDFQRVPEQLSEDNRFVGPLLQSP